MKYFILSVLLLVGMASCQKTPTQPESREDILRTGRWKITSGKAYLWNYMSGRPLQFILPDSIPDCHNDDYVVFGPGFSGTISSGTKQCSLSEPAQISFRWAPLQNDSAINLYGAGAILGVSTTMTKFINYTYGSDIVTAAIKDFSDQSFTIEYYYSYPNPLNNRDLDSSSYDLTFTRF